MSYGGNNSNSGRSSIFETFHSPNFGDETFEVQPLSQPLKISSRPSQPETTNTLTQKRSLDSLLSVQQQSAGGQQEQEVEDYVMDDDEEDDASSSDNAQTTLWMSCSPGRDLTDDEADEEWGESTSQEMNEERGFGEDGGKSSDEENNEDEDDGLPLSKLAGKQFVDQGLIHSNVKRVKSIKLKKAGKDKIGPKKEIALNSKKKMKMKLKKRSAYSFFYHDTQNAIKSQNPAATFGEISKIVASMWDHLESGLKEDYSRRAEEYNTQHKDQVLLSAKLKSKKPKKSSSSSTKSKHKLLDTEIKSESLDSVDSSAFKVKLELKDVKDESGDSVDGNSISFSGSGRSKMPKEEKQEKDSKPKPLCNYTKCQNPAVDDPRWEFNYCSPQCVISHCKDVFKAWVANRKSAYCET